MRGLLYACCFAICLCSVGIACFASGGDAHTKNNTTAKVYPEIKAWHQSASKCFALRLDDKGDSLVDKQIIFAEEHNDMQLMREVLFGTPRFELLGSVSRTHKNIVTIEASQKTLTDIMRTLDFAKAQRNNADVALAYKLLSTFHMAQGSFSEASRYANLAYTTALNTKNDSVKVICGLQLGYTYVQEMNALMAFKTYTTALDIATEKHNPVLLQKVYLHFADMYRKLDKKEDAKAWALRSLTMNEQNHDNKALIDDYLFLGKLHDYKIGLEYLNKALKLAEKENELFAKVEIEKVVFSYKLISTNSNVPLKYLEEHKNLRLVYSRTGPFYLDWVIAEVYLYGGQANLAYTYFIKARTDFLDEYNQEIRKNFFSELADCYFQLDSVNAAIINYEKVYRLCTTTSDFPLLIDVLDRLKELHHRKKEHEQAYRYSQLVMQYKDSVHRMANEKEMALHEIENLEKEKHTCALVSFAKKSRAHSADSINFIFFIHCFLFNNSGIKTIG